MGDLVLSIGRRQVDDSSSQLVRQPSMLAGEQQGGLASCCGRELTALRQQASRQQ